MLVVAIVAWNVAATKAIELVDVPLRMALWQRGRKGHPVVRGERIRPSIGSVCDACTNALTECVIGH